jgi:DNA repair protein RadA/Sms
MEGTRPVLVEIQALVAPSTLGTPRRAVIGWDSARLSMVLAVLEAHCGVKLGQHDVYLNVAGGYRISEPAADLAVAAALVSSLSGVSLPDQSVYFGEISLSGATRPVSHGPSRMKEAEKLGFGRAILPKGSAAPKSKKDQAKIDANLELVEISELADLVARILAKAGKAKNPHNPENRD